MVASHIDSSPGDPQAGRQGKEGLVSSAFLIQWTFVLYSSLFLFQPPAAICAMFKALLAWFELKTL